MSSTWNDTPTSNGCQVVVNGSSKGALSSITSPSGRSGDVIRAVASYYGVKNFSVYVDGRKFYTEQANDPFPATAQKLEIVAKDARGLTQINNTTQPGSAEPGNTTQPTPEPVPTDQGDEQPEPAPAAA